MLSKISPVAQDYGTSERDITTLYAKDFKKEMAARLSDSPARNL